MVSSRLYVHNPVLYLVPNLVPQLVPHLVLHLVVILPLQRVVGLDPEPGLELQVPSTGEYEDDNKPSEL